MKLHSPTYVYSREIKLKITVINQDGDTLQKGRVGVDRDTISLQRLLKHVAKLFKLNSAFLLMYHVPNENGEGTMAIVDDWDLEVALQQPTPSLKITIQTQGPSFDSQPGNCDVLSLEDTCYSDIPKEPATTRILSSFIDKVVHKVEGLVFPNKNDEDKDGRIACTKPPMTHREFQLYLDEEGRLVNYQAFRENVYLGGISHSIRKVAWRHLLCVFPEGMTANERIEYLKKRSKDYTELRDKWKAVLKNTEIPLPEHIRFVTNMVKKDVIRTDRNHKYYKGKEDNKHTLALYDLLCTYSINHPDTSYCQGMCDLASPLLAVQDNEAHAYLLFCAVMQRMKHNFSFDGKSISTKFEHLTQLLKFFDPEFYSYMQEHQVDDLLFTYRWLLLEMKREFPFCDSLYFSEVMWSSLPTVPSNKDIPFQQADIAINPGSMPRRLSAFSKMNTLDCDNDSISITSSTVFSIFPDCDVLSLNGSINERQSGTDQVHMYQTDEEEHEDGDTGPPPSIASFSSPCQCISPTDSEYQPNSVFYFDLEGNEVWRQCHCAKSVDSGYLSRPSSPVKPEFFAQHNHVNTLERSPSLSQQFPPPKKFGYGNPFLLFAASAMILQQRDIIMENKMDFNDIVMLFNSYKCQHDVHLVLKEAKQLYEAYISNDLEPDEEDFVHVEMPSVSQHLQGHDHGQDHGHGQGHRQGHV